MNRKTRKIIVFLLFFLLIFGNSLSSIAAISESPVGEEKDKLAEPAPVEVEPPQEVETKGGDLKEDIVDNPPGDGGDYQEECHGEITIAKVMDETQAALLGVDSFDFEVYDTTGGLLHTITVPIGSSATFPNLADGETFIVKEIIPPEYAAFGLNLENVQWNGNGGMEDYPFSGNQFDFTVPGGTTTRWTFTVTNEVPVGSITVKKLIDGVVPDEDYGTFRVQVQNSEGNVGVAALAPDTDEPYTDEITPLLYGNYTLYEIADAFSLYQFLGWSGDGSSGAGSGEWDVVVGLDNPDVVVFVENELKKGSITFTKKIRTDGDDGRTNDAIPATDIGSFGIHVWNNDGYDENITLAFDNDTPYVYTLEDLDLGQYFFEETSMPSNLGFNFMMFESPAELSSGDVYEVTLKLAEGDEDEVLDVDIDVINEIEKCTIYFYKEIKMIGDEGYAIPSEDMGTFSVSISPDPDGLSPIELNLANSYSAEVTMRHAVYTLSETMTSGDFEFAEFTSPAYLDNDLYKLDVNDNTCGLEVGVRNDELPKGKIIVHKYIEGSRFESQQLEFHVSIDGGVTSKIIGEGQIATFENLEFDTPYTLEELQELLNLPEGYTFEKIVEGTDPTAAEFTGTITLTENQPERTFTVVNKRQPTGEVIVYKGFSDALTDVRDSDRTKDFEVTLYKLDDTGDLDLGSKFIDQDGLTAQWTDLEDGLYKLIETDPLAPWSVTAYAFQGEGGTTSAFVDGTDGIEFEIGDVDVDGLLTPINNIRVDVTNYRQPQGKITVYKNIDNFDSDTQFEIWIGRGDVNDIEWLVQGVYIQEGAPFVFDSIPNSGITGLPDDTYYIREIETTNFEFVQYQKTLPLDVNIVNVREPGIAVVLNENQEEVEVTVTNHKEEDPKAGLRIYKRVIYMDGDEEVIVTWDETIFDISVMGGDFVETDGTVSVPTSWYEANLQYSILGDIVDYEIIEMEETGYAFVDMFLLDDGVDGSSIVNDYTLRRGYLEELEEGDVTEVVIVNEILDPRGQVTLTKRVTEDGSTRSGDSGTFVLALTGPEEYYEEVTIVGNGSETINDLPFGEYTVSEVSRSSSRYTLESISPETFTVDIHNLVHASTVTNDYDPPERRDPDPDPTRLRVYKDVVNNLDAGDFDFIIDGPSYDNEEVSLADGDRWSRSVEAGTYTISEDIPENYSLEVEVDGRVVSQSPDGTVEVDVDEETTVEVRFMNTYEEEEETVTVIEDVTPQAVPDPIPEPEEEPVIILEDIVPLAIDTLPQTGETAPELFYVFGSVIAGLGYAMRKKFRK